MNNDTSSDTDLLTSDEPSAGDLAREFVRPAFAFKGEPLRPYTAGTDLLFTQVLDRNDANMTAILSFVFIHRKNLDRAALMELCWDKNKFRVALLDWIDSIGLDDADKDEATRLFTAMREAASKGAVDVIPEGGAEKKRKASRPAKSRS